MQQKSKIPTIYFMVIVVFLTMTACTVSKCSNDNTDKDMIEFLRGQAIQHEMLIKEYENFRQLSKDIYINQVDSTGDGFDETDKGIDFWRAYERIDSLTNTISFD